jgi:hypothetical protein
MTRDMHANTDVHAQTGINPWIGLIVDKSAVGAKNRADHWKLHAPEGEQLVHRIATILRTHRSLCVARNIVLSEGHSGLGIRIK